jgi:hypothetical protein
VEKEEPQLTDGSLRTGAKEKDFNTEGTEERHREHTAEKTGRRLGFYKGF